LIFEVDGAGRAEFFAGFALALEEIDAGIGIDRVFERHRLGILHVNGFAFAQAAVIGVGNFLGTFFGTGIAGNALFHVDVTGVLGQFDFKIALFAVNALNFAERQQFDVDVPADLDQFG
jgi:hypothetical protein